jgi:RNA polymerase sigma-70 factor (ECF subfamily)
MHASVDPEQRFRRLYDSTYPDILGYLARRIGELEAVDAAADVFLVAWGRIDDVPEGEAARPWLFGVARNVLRNRRRASRRYWGFLNRYRGLGGGGSSGEPESIVVRRRECEAVLAGLEGLRPAERELLRLVAWEELPYAEIAELLGCSRHAVDQRVQRAFHHLAREMGRSGQVRDRGISTGEERA